MENYYLVPVELIDKLYEEGDLKAIEFVGRYEGVITDDESNLMQSSFKLGSCETRLEILKKCKIVTQ